MTLYTCHALDGLLDLKKQRLLLSLQSVTEDPSGFTDGVEQDRRGGEEEGEGEREEGGWEGSDGSDDLQGIKCRAPMEEVCDYSVDLQPISYSIDSQPTSHTLFLPCSHGVRSTIIMQLSCAGRKGVTQARWRRRRE